MKHIFLFGLLFALSSQWGCSSSEQATAQEFETEQQLVNVKTEPVEARAFVEYYQTIGVIKPNKDVMLSCEVSGQIEKVLFEKGDRVKKGAILVQIDRRLSQASYEEAKAGYELAESNFQRLKELYEQKSSISDSEYDAARFNRDMAKARLTQTETLLEKSEIRSPINGIVVNKFIEIGEVAGPGSPIAQLIDIQSVKIEIGLPENEIGFFHIGSSATATLDGYPNETFSGAISYIGSQVHVGHRTFPAEIKMENPDIKLKSEMAAKVKLVKKEYESAIVVPKDAVLETENGKAIFVLIDGDVCQLKSVTLGALQGNSVIVQKGLSVGDILITVGQRDIVDGEKVRVMDRK
ncbi:MAG: hypothetical protein B6244_00845 [Candidatus Cloacimonetes bacterium 4572_55]|nr:MAG: hypothetical protein B6244_00845 [Candidatus Cloacimonetes bacterium 4572_55]